MNDDFILVNSDCPDTLIEEKPCSTYDYCTLLDRGHCPEVDSCFVDLA